VTENASSAGLVPVPRLDHVMVLLDRTAYQAVQADSFVSERFARLKRKEADSSAAGQYATLGVAGENTLVELFGDQVGGGSSPLTGGLVFSFEEPGSSAAAKALLDATGTVACQYDLVTRAQAGGGQQQPWYHLINVDLGASSPLLLFLNEVTPQYFAAIGARPTAQGMMRRRDYLDATLGKPTDDAYLMRDISGVTALVDRQRAQRIADALLAFGYECKHGDDSLELYGPDLVLRLQYTESAVDHIAEIEIQLTPDPAVGLLASDVTFGESSRLAFASDGKARWTFSPPGGMV
jgi:Family of unknown function (DUF5829)